ncbi:glycoside hydrolase family 30 protein [Bifidobacterium eulemuris]|uniref:Glycosyl hydrolase family 30 n=1 Tax=Bifidobacterium eulemuris TaxID=1765219 RepID=A0A261G516_9BIFI|nr:glycosyl hydrolase family 30 [Bifidobacterium eulemuris]OZG66484.1 glycosyl hydrolase family 30 [Bifidobacterium eulemuris]QOL32580.1 glycosyl hydrolase family 30 [Bifidobacterium eulemuris]
MNPINEYAYEYWTRTSGDLADRRAPIPTPDVTDELGDAVAVVIDPTREYQMWEGVGAAITDSSAYLFMTAMSAEQRHAILSEMFDPEQGGFSSVRISIGACDFSSQKYYTYDDLPEGVAADPSLAYFSIGEGEPGAPDATRDMKYVVPVLKEILAINPAVKIMASPWSAPAWMKTSNRIDGAGRLRLGEYVGNGYRYQDTIDYVYAQYFVKFIAAYARLGIRISSVTMQNEPSNGCPWPITVWTPEELAVWGSEYLRPALDRSFPDVEIYFGDDSLRFWQRPASEYMTPAQANAFAGAAFHTYSGLPEWVGNGTRQFPHWKAAMTERRCMLDETVAEASHVMFGEIGTWMVRNGVGLINLWNMALDERGWPSWAGTSGRRGVITVDSSTGKVKRNLEYFMLRNFGQDVSVGSRRVASTNRTPDGRNGGLGSVAFVSRRGDLSAILHNPTDTPIETAVTVNGEGPRWQKAVVPAYGTVSLRKSDRPVNTTQAPSDDEFEIVCTPHPADDHDETLF